MNDLQLLQAVVERESPSDDKAACDTLAHYLQDRLADAFTAGVQLALLQPAIWCEDTVVTTCGGLVSDTHPTPEGYQDMAELLFSAASTRPPLFSETARSAEMPPMSTATFPKSAGFTRPPRRS